MYVEHVERCQCSAEEQDGEGCRRWRFTADNMVYSLACAASALAFLGALIGAPVYLYLIRLPGLECSE